MPIDQISLTIPHLVLLISIQGFLTINHIQFSQLMQQQKIQLIIESLVPRTAELNGKQFCLIFEHITNTSEEFHLRK